MSNERPTVAFLTPRMPHYRLSFFGGLREELTRRGIRLVVIHGTPSSSVISKRDEAELPWAIKAPTTRIRVGRHTLYWYPWWRHAGSPDLTIIGQAAANLSVYPLFAQQLIRGRRIAFAGHGRNLDATRASRTAEALKRFLSKRPDWWFAYTTVSERLVTELGFPPERITVFNNAIDTRELIEAHEALRPEDVDQIRASLGLRTPHVGLFVGSMTPQRRLRFLLEALQHVRAALPQFEAIFIGAGPEQALIEHAAKRHRWIHYVGPKFGLDRVPYFALSRIFLMPGRIGLAILDALSLGVPPVTCADAPHSPEIAYLDSNRNGVMLPSGAQARQYAEEVCALLNDERRRHRLVEGGKETTQVVTLENMVLRFAEGIESALLADRRRRFRTKRTDAA